jgi:hypothetical protein
MHYIHEKHLYRIIYMIIQAKGAIYFPFKKDRRKLK